MAAISPRLISAHMSGGRRRVYTSKTFPITGTLLGGATALMCAVMLALAAASLPASTGVPPTLSATIETLVSVVGLAAAWLACRRFRRSGSRLDLLVAVAVLAFTLLRVITAAIPAALSERPDALLVGSDICGGLLTDVVIAAAAFASRDSLLAAVRHPDRRLAAISLSVVGLAVTGGFIVSHVLLGGSMVTGAAARHSAAIAVVATAGGVLSCAAIGFARDGGRHHDGVELLIVAGLIVMAAALPLQLGPTRAGDFSLIADALQGVGFSLIAVGALRSERETRQLAVRAAALAERRRIARDLHDSLAQDLAFIAAHGSRIGADVGVNHAVVTAAQRALAVSRSAITELSDRAAATPREALEMIAAELGCRYGLSVTVDVDTSCELSADLHEHVERITREAIVNAARHGGARTVVVSLRATADHLRVRIEDDGIGIDSVTRGHRREGFGLRTIRERVESVGGDLEIRQLGGRGTVLEAVLT